MKGLGLRSEKEAWIGMDRTRLRFLLTGYLVSCSGGRVAECGNLASRP